jgi:hypothetical protein
VSPVEDVGVDVGLDVYRRSIRYQRKGVWERVVGLHQQIFKGRVRYLAVG